MIKRGVLRAPVCLVARGMLLVCLTASTVSAALPAGQQSADVGGPAIHGSATYGSGIYTIKGAGADVWGAADEFHYVYLLVTGDVDVRVRVASVTNTDMWAKAGIMIREALTADARHAFVAATPAAGYAFQRRPDTGGASESTSGGTGAPPGWVRLVRAGSTFAAYRSADGVTWTSIGTDVVPIGAMAYVGLAVTSHNASALTTALFTNLSIVEASPTANRPPAVSLTSPVDGAAFADPATLVMSASVSDQENRVGGVGFFVDGVLVGIDTGAPFSLTSSGVAAGTYSILALAWDTGGAYSLSAPASVVVGSAAPRAVTFVASPDHATLVTSYVLRVFGEGSDPRTAAPVASSSLGKPAPNSSGEITVDRAAFFSALPRGNYVSVVAAVGSRGESNSEPVAFTR
jgi:regulation of enolase protein 1 (concanavalin A-like superfamily)